MGFIYTRGNRLWIRYKDHNGKLKSDSTGLDVSQHKKAEKVLEMIEARIAAGANSNEVELGALTLNRYAAKWIKERRDRGVWSIEEDEGRLLNHVLPRLGSMMLEEILPRHVQALFRSIKS